MSRLNACFSWAPRPAISGVLLVVGPLCCPSFAEGTTPRLRAVEANLQPTISMRLVLTLVLVVSSGAVLPSKPIHVAPSAEQSDSGTKNKAAEVDDRLARYTKWLTVLTGGLVVVGFLQWAVLRRQGSQLEREFLTTHRPKVKVRRVTYDRPGDGYTVIVELADVGYGGAKLVEAKCALIPSEAGTEQPWRILEALNVADTLRDAAIPPNGSYLLRYAITDPERVYAFTLADAVYAVGYAVYSDAKGRGSFRLGFVRRAERDVRVFFGVDDPDFEYED